MKKALTLGLVLLSINSFAQCVKCKSLEEAQKDVGMVKSIKINPYSGGEMTEIPESIGDFPNLEELFLTDLGIKEVPAAIGKLKNLKSLGLAGNSLEKLPDEIFELKNLEELILFSNEFPKAYKANLKKQLKAKLPGVKLMID